MPRVNEPTLLAVDTIVQGAGALLLGVVVLRLIRSGRARNPLAGLTAVGGPGLLHVALVLASFYVLVLFGAQLGRLDPQAAAASGSQTWHLARLLEDAARLAAAALAVVLLRRHPCFPSAARRRNPLRLAGLGLVTTLIMLPVCYAQLESGKLVWHWLAPRVEPPVHPVLVALTRSQWGAWGAVHLSLTAIVVVPLAEELFFRGLLLGALWRQLGRAWPAIAISAAAFGLVHSAQPQDVLPLVSMGLILGYVRLRYRSLAVCVVAHALFNARTMILVLLAPQLVQGW